jgi:hypothetical protein
MQYRADIMSGTSAKMQILSNCHAEIKRGDGENGEMGRDSEYSSILLCSPSLLHPHLS